MNNPCIHMYMCSSQQTLIIAYLVVIGYFIYVCSYYIPFGILVAFPSSSNTDKYTIHKLAK